MNKLIYAVALSVSVSLMGVNSGVAEAAATRNVTLKWAANPQSVIGYEVYFGKTTDQTEMRLLPVPSTMNLTAPAVRFDVLRDLVAMPGQTACFRVKAFDNTARSSFSTAVCTTI